MLLDVIKNIIDDLHATYFVYLLFLISAILIFHNIPHKWRTIFLLIISYLFYFCIHPFCPVILILISLSGYFFGIKISESKSDKTKKSLLFKSILLNLLILISFRYTGDLISIINFLFNLKMIYISSMSCIGFSFFIFQNISYLIDCYLEKITPEKNFLYYALYLSFFPKLLQGPIERANNLIPQFKQDIPYKYFLFREGALLFIWGMFKKFVIADNLALFTGMVLNNIGKVTCLEALLVSYFYALQIYCDFSGYTDMSLGIAKFFGINLTDNFNYPYFSKSIQEFWRRWHITLSGWILDYIFKPLQIKWRYYGNYGLTLSLIITFLICGLWHGLTLNYVLWGIYHGILISISFLTNKKWKKIPFFINVFLTFQLVCFSWMIFMTKNLADLLLLLSRIFSNSGFTVHLPFPIYFLAIIIIFVAIEILQAKFNIKTYFDKQCIIIRWLCYYIIVCFILFWVPSNQAGFIYFQF